MPRDYAKKSKGKKRTGASRSNKKNRPSLLLVIITFIATASLITLLVYLQWYQPKPTTLPKNKEVPNKTQTNKKSSNQSEVEEVPFYKTHEEMLNKKVEIPEEDLKLPETTEQFEYIMPCGSFRDETRAEELKAQIAFSGYESNILRVEYKGETWYRVELGPFKSKRKTESIRHRLQDNGFSYCKIWPKRIK